MTTDLGCEIYKHYLLWAVWGGLPRNQGSLAPFPILRIIVLGETTLCSCRVHRGNKASNVER